MLSINHQFAVVLFDGDGETLGSAAVEADWVPAIEWASWQFRRKGELSLTDGRGAASIQPLWNREMGEPYCRGVRISFARNGLAPCTSDFPVTYFRAGAAKAAALFVEKGKLKKDGRFHYVVVALENDAAAAPSCGGLQVEERVAPLHVVDSSLPEWQDRATPVGLVDGDDMALFCPRHVLD